MKFEIASVKKPHCGHSVVKTVDIHRTLRGIEFNIDMRWIPFTHNILNPDITVTRCERLYMSTVPKKAARDVPLTCNQKKGEDAGESPHSQQDEGALHLQQAPVTTRAGEVMKWGAQGARRGGYWVGGRGRNKEGRRLRRLRGEGGYIWKNTHLVCIDGFQCWGKIPLKGGKKDLSPISQ